MKNPFSGSSRKWKGLSFIATLVALSAVALAWNITWNVPVSLVVNTVDLKVYWEENCTTPVTTIDFGKINHTSTSYWLWMWIKNEGLGSVTMRWNSTLPVVTNKISDNWINNGGYAINGTSISHDQVIQTRYLVYLYQNVDPGSYSWTLYLGAEQ